MKLIVNDKLKEISAGEELKRKRAEEQMEHEIWQSQFNERK